MSDTAINQIIQYGTAAERALYVPDPPTISGSPVQTLYIWTDTDNLPTTADTWIWDAGTSAWVQVNPAGSGGTVTNTGTLTDHALIVGNGGVDVSALGSLGTTTTVLHGNAAGDPSFGAVSLTADVSGDLPFANLVQATGASKIVGRGSASGAGDFEELTLGSGVALTGTVLSATGSGGDVTHTGTLTSGDFITGNGGADVTAVTPTAATALLDDMVGDSGSGGTKGLVPAPAAGDAAAGKFLKADGTFAVPPGGGGSGTVTNTGTLTANALILGNGTVDVTALGSLGTTTTLLHGNAAGAPTFGAVDLAADVTGNLPVTNLDSGTSASSSTFWRGDGTWAAPSGGGGADFTNAGNPQGVVSGSPGQTCRDTTNGVLYIKEGGGSTAYGWYRSQFSPYEGNVWMVCANPASAGSVTNMGTNSATVSNGNGGTTGSITGRFAAGMAMGLTSGTSTATGASVVNNTGNIGGNGNVDAVFLIQTDTSTVATHVRYMIGLFNSNTPQNTDSLGLGGAVCFRYSTTAGDTGWVGVTENAFGGQSVTATVGSIAANTVYKLRIRYFASGTVYFSVNDGTEVSTSTQVPTPSNANFALQVVISNPDGGGTGGTGRELGFYRHWGWNGIGS